MSATQTTALAFAFGDNLIRALAETDAEPWFVAGDIAAILGYRNAPDMVRMLDDDETGTQIVRTRSENGTEQNREVTVINESGLYSAILRSRRPEAKQFKKWVTAEVLPAIRRHGHYGTAGAGLDLSPVTSLLTQLLGRFDRLELQLTTFMATARPRRCKTPKGGPVTIEMAVQAKLLAAEGMPGNEIAASLGISPTAVSLILNDKYPFVVRREH